MAMPMFSSFRGSEGHTPWCPCGAGGRDFGRDKYGCDFCRIFNKEWPEFVPLPSPRRPVPRSSDPRLNSLTFGVKRYSPYWMDISYDYKLLHYFYLRSSRDRPSTSMALRTLSNLISTLERFTEYNHWHWGRLERIVQRLHELRRTTAYYHTLQSPFLSSRFF
jgi:hypothetical protein